MSEQSASAQATKQRIRWFVYAGPNAAGRLEKIPRTAKMRGWWAGYDAECSCGWESLTGGASRGDVQNAVWFHRNYECPLRRTVGSDEQKEGDRG